MDPDFNAVYDQQLTRVYGFFALRVKSREEAEDLTQLTFERALRAWSRYDPARSPVVPWLLTIARNSLIDHYRTDRRGDRTSLDELGEGAGHNLPSVELAASLGLDPDLEQALAGLGERERELLALRYVIDLTGAEIASLTGLSLSNVQQILSRTLRSLRERLDASRSRR